MHDAERVVAVGHRVHEHPNREKVVDLLVRLLPLQHLLVDRPEMLRASRDLELLDAGVTQRLVERVAELRDELLTLAALLRDLARERLVLLRLEVLEGQVLELPPHLRHAEAMRERRVQIPGFDGDAAPFFVRQRIQRAHVVQPVRELDDDDARVLRDGQEQLAIALDLPLLLRSTARQLGDLREAVDDGGDLLPELTLDVGDRDVRVLDDVVDQTTGDGHRVELELGEDLRDLDAVRDERLAGQARLTAVCLLAEPIGARQQLAVETIRLERVGPTRDQFAGCGRGHSSPASAKLV